MVQHPTRADQLGNRPWTRAPDADADVSGSVIRDGGARRRAPRTRLTRATGHWPRTFDVNV